MTNWAQTITTNSYTANVDDCFIFINNNSQNCTIIIPSEAPLGSGYIIKQMGKINIVSNVVTTIVTITTDNANCFIDTLENFILNTSYAFVELIMGPDDNYWTVGGGAGVAGVAGNTSGNNVQADIYGTSNQSGFYIIFLNTNYIPTITDNTSCIAIGYDETTILISTNNHLELYF